MNPGSSWSLLTLTFPRLDSGSGAGMTNTPCSAGDHGPPWVGVAVGEHTAVIPAKAGIQDSGGAFVPSTLNPDQPRRSRRPLPRTERAGLHRRDRHHQRQPDHHHHRPRRHQRRPRTAPTDPRHDRRRQQRANSVRVIIARPQAFSGEPPPGPPPRSTEETRKMPGASRLLKEPLDRNSLWTPSKNF